MCVDFRLYGEEMMDYRHEIVTYFLLIALFASLCLYFLIFTIPLIILGLFNGKKYLIQNADKIADLFIKE